MGGEKFTTTPFLEQWKRDAAALKDRLSLCPRCGEAPADPVLLGRPGEGHVCGRCWQNDRAFDEQST